MQDSNSNTIPPADEIEISLSDIIQFFRSNIRSMVFWGIAFGIIGTIYAFTAQKEFESKVVVLPEIQSMGGSKLGGLGALAGLAGIDVGSMGGTEAIRPDLYPNVTQSLPFVLFLLQQPIYISESKKTQTLQAYFESLNQGLLDDILDFEEKVKPKLDPQQFSKAVELDLKQENLIKDLQKRVVTTFDRKSGIITINVKMPDPVVAATVARLSVEYLKEYVTTYRTDKTRKQLKFLEKQVSEAKGRVQSTEASLASYRDRNSFLVMNTAKVTEQRIQSEFMLAQNVYNGLVQQYEQAKIKVEEETPVFKMLEPPKIPLYKSEPKRLALILMFIVIGVVLSISYLIGRKMIVKYL